MSNIYNCCSLCLEEDKYNGGNLIWKDGMQLCESCYNHYTNDGDYIKHIMTLNAIKRYRRKIAELEETISDITCIPEGDEIDE